MKRLLSLILASALLSLAVPASAVPITINFDNTECPTCSSPVPVVGDEWVSYGISLVGQAYFYIDGRDTFDGQGLSVDIDPASLLLAGPSNNATIDYWVIGGFTGLYEAFDGSNNLLGSLFVDATQGGDILGTHTFLGAVSSIVWSGTRGFAQISTLTIDVSEPGTLALFMMGFGLLLARRRLSA